MDEKTVNDAGLEQEMDRDLYAKIQPGLQVRSLDDEFVGTVAELVGKRSLRLTDGEETHQVPLSWVRSADDVAVYLDQDAETVKKGQKSDA